MHAVNFQACSATKDTNSRAAMFKLTGAARANCDSDDTICTVTSFLVTCCPPSHTVCCDSSLGGCCSTSFPVCCSDAHGGCCPSGQTCAFDDDTGRPTCSCELHAC